VSLFSRLGEKPTYNIILRSKSQVLYGSKTNPSLPALTNKEKSRWRESVLDNADYSSMHAVIDLKEIVKCLKKGKKGQETPLSLKPAIYLLAPGSLDTKPLGRYSSAS
jgi:hypothetical protein